VSIRNPNAVSNPTPGRLIVSWPEPVARTPRSAAAAVDPPSVIVALPSVSETVLASASVRSRRPP
jgi:hypothetical protein